MIKLLLFLLLMVSTNVFAEWTKVTDSADGSFSVYVDYGFIKKKGNKVTMWYVYDFEKVQILIEIIRYLDIYLRHVVMNSIVKKRRCEG
jgi:hypothetical protein